MCQFFDKLGYPVSFAQVDHYHAQKIDRQSALPKAQKENGDRIQFTLTFHLTTTQLNLSFCTWGLYIAFGLIPYIAIIFALRGDLLDKKRFLACLKVILCNAPVAFSFWRIK